MPFNLVLLGPELAVDGPRSGFNSSSSAGGGVHKGHRLSRRGRPRPKLDAAVATHGGAVSTNEAEPVRRVSCPAEGLAGPRPDDIDAVQPQRRQLQLLRERAARGRAVGGSSSSRDKNGSIGERVVWKWPREERVIEAVP